MKRLLLKDWQDSKDKFALESLVAFLMRVSCLLGKGSSAIIQAEREDLISEGILGLIHAADLFDLTVHVRFFGTYGEMVGQERDNDGRAITCVNRGDTRRRGNALIAGIPIDDDESFALLLRRPQPRRSGDRSQSSQKSDPRPSV